MFVVILRVIIRRWQRLYLTELTILTFLYSRVAVPLKMSAQQPVSSRILFYLLSDAWLSGMRTIDLHMRSDE